MKQYELNQREQIILKRVGIELSNGFLHLNEIDESFPLENVRSLYITRPKEDKTFTLRGFLKQLFSGDDYSLHYRDGFTGKRPPKLRTIHTELKTGEIISYQLTDIDSITLSKIFKRIFEPPSLTNTGIN